MERISQYVLHLPGRGKKKLGTFLDRWEQVSVNKDVTVVTIATPDVIDNCVLIKQLKESNIQFINGSDYVELYHQWKKVDKLPMMCAALERVTTPYVLIMDANDAIITNNIDEEFIEKWKEFDSPLVYNSSEYLYPKIFPHPKEVYYDAFLYSQHYLNAGVAFGETWFAKKFYEEAFSQSNRSEYLPFDSEQYYVRIAWVKFNEMKLDIHSKLFLLSHGN